MKIVIDTNVFLRVAFEEPGWEYCGKLLDDVYSGQHDALMSSIQLSELFTPFERARDKEAREEMSIQLEKLRIRIKDVTREIAGLSAHIRATKRTPKGRWLALGDSIILATSQIEKVETLFTLDTDFSEVGGPVNVSAPGMSIEEWDKEFGLRETSEKRGQKKRARLKDGVPPAPRRKRVHGVSN